MSSDEAYGSFLDKANQDVGSGRAGHGPSSGFTSTQAITADVPSSLQQVQAYYISETEEPFKPVSLKWTESTLPDDSQFKGLIGHNNHVEIIAIKTFNPRGEYDEVLRAVRKASAEDSSLRVYLVQHDDIRTEYYVLALDEKGSRLVGLKAKSVTS
ncbi:MAG: hypothetical protein M1825_001156 [Sarcosagium campestre]|nr:MAG: hypothetical protein M1825_001156 [Sarcosagium campestre]